MSFQGRSIVVTGGAGFIGSHLVEEILALGARVVIVDNMSLDYDITIKKARVSKLQLYPACTMEYVDICNRLELLRVFAAHAPCMVYHLAARAGIRRCESSPEVTWRTNVEGTASILEACTMTPSVKHIVFASSSSVYGNQPTPWNERLTLLQPLSLYARTKVLGEQLCQQTCGQQRISLRILRPFSVYGPQGRPDMAIAKFTSALLRRTSIDLYGFGAQLRDNTHVLDVVQGFLLAGHHQLSAEAPSSMTFNVGTGRSCPISEILELIQQTLQRTPVELIQKPANPVDALHTLADPTAALTHLGFRATRDLAQGIAMTVQAEIPCQLYIAVVVATYNRLELLTRRCLPSISKQTRQPNAIILVNDAPGGESTLYHDQVRAWLDLNMPEVQLICNNRTRGASGAWNSGILHVLSGHAARAHEVYIAFCDDDDAWAPNHLATVGLYRTDLVVTGIVWFQDDEGKLLDMRNGLALSIPTQLTPEDFLQGNPHVQGSNLFLRLDVLCQAGLFDERLSSCTDRDLLIRVLDLPALTIAFSQKHTVHHFADGLRDRLSNQNKHHGLDAFWHKYRHRMSNAVQATCQERAARLFNWYPPPSTPITVRAFSTPVPKTTNSPQEVPVSLPYAILVIGITSDSHSSVIRGLLLDLGQLLPQCSTFLVSMDVVVLENGPSHTGQTLKATVSAIETTYALRILYLSLDRQRQDMAAGFLPPHQTLDARASIAETRTRLQLYTAAMARQQISKAGMNNDGNEYSTAVWILDDDKRLPPSFPLEAVFRAHVKDPSMAVLLGVDIQSPPLPPAFSVRTQLVDIVVHAQWCLNTDADMPLLNRSHENPWHVPNYYHDLNTPALETPFWLDTTGKTSRMLFLTTLPSSLESILAGTLVTRPIQIMQPHDLEEDYHYDYDDHYGWTYTPSVLRGGCTFVFDLDCLVDATNAVPPRHRRSDMIWSLLQSHVYGKRVVQCPQVQVLHVRDTIVSKAELIEVARKDVAGHALYQALQTVMTSSNPPWNSQWHFFWRTYETAFIRRSTELRASLERIRGLLWTLKGVLMHPQAWWNSLVNDENVSIAKQKMMDTLMHLQERFDMAWNNDNIDDGRVVYAPFSYVCSKDIMQSWFQDDLFRRRMPWTSLQWQHFSTNVYRVHRIRAAKTCLAVLLQVPVSVLEWIGIGDEGVSFKMKCNHSSDYFKCIKYMDLYVLRDSDRRGRSFLKRLPAPAKAFLQDMSLHMQGLHVWIEKTFVEGSILSEASQRKCVVDAPLHFAQGCREANICCNNIKPANLIVSKHSGRLAFVDIGLDIVGWTPQRELAMLRKLYLTWKWLHRQDLPQLLSDAVASGCHIPELTGFPLFQSTLAHWIMSPAQKAKYTEDNVLDIILPWIQQEKCALNLLYVGSTPMPTRLSKSVVQCTEYLLPFDHNTIQIFNNEEFINGPYDIVACMFMLQPYVDKAILFSILTKLRVAVHVHGMVVVALRNPFFDSNELPWHVWQHNFCRAGFHVHQMAQTKDATSPIVTLEPYSACLVVQLKPLVLEREAPRAGTCTLLIKACAMEHATLRTKIVHLKQQLEGPRVFDETLVVIDSRTLDFPRPYDEPNLSACLEVCRCLERDQWIDRWLYSPPSPLDVETMHSKWFGHAHSNSHASTNGAPVITTLMAIEAAQCDFILQIDSDLMIARSSYLDDYIGCAMKIFASDQRTISVALDICREHAAPPSYCNSSGDAHRIEVRGCFFQKDRLLAHLPMPQHECQYLDPPNVSKVRPWYRAMDEAIQDFGWGRSYRMHAMETFFIHPPNTIKTQVENYGLLLDNVAKHRIPFSYQQGVVDCHPRLDDWVAALPARSEDIVVVILGHNVSPPKIVRCLESLEAQEVCSSLSPVGVVLIDDGSTPDVAFFIRWYCQHKSSFTVIQPCFQRFVGANTVLAIRHVCKNPNSIVVTLDMDDCLIGDKVWTILHTYYHDRSADATIGNMLRSDKTIPNPYPVTLIKSRTTRGGGNVWKHLRTFRKYLFDRILDEDLRDDTNGTYFTHGFDWAIMLPIVEMAFSPVVVTDVVYWYEPTGHDKQQTEVAISQIVQRPRYPKQRPLIAVVGDARLHPTTDDSFKRLKLFELGQALVDAGYCIVCGGLDGAMLAVARGAHASPAWFEGSVLGLVPGSDAQKANSFIDRPLATGMGMARNCMLGLADAMVAVGGGAGTLSELACAWSSGRLVIGIASNPSGTTDRFLGQPLDRRQRYPKLIDDQIYLAKDIPHAVALLKQFLPLYRKKRQLPM